VPISSSAPISPEVQLQRPEGIALDFTGNVLVADYGRDRIVKLSPDGRLLQAWGTRGTGTGEFVGPKGVAVDPSTGKVYVADTGNGRVQRLLPDGTPETTWAMPPVSSAGS
jgi:DNA-binding beta-propeller fold protein YncE